MPMCHTGTPAQAEGDLKPLRSVGQPALDAVGPMPYPVVNTLLDAAFPKGALNYWKSTFLRELSDDAIGMLIAAYADVPSPMSCIVIEHLHGAVTRVPVDATAFPHRDPGFNVLVLGQWLDPSESSANLAWTLATYQALQPWSRGGGYMNYFSADDATRTPAAYGPNLDRLRALKRRLDPDNVFHLNQNVLPSD
jgi:FAD/FMN-containing dehydrogenase